MKQRFDELFQIISDLADECIERRDIEKYFEVAVGSRILFRAGPNTREADQSALLAVESVASVLKLIGDDRPARPREPAPACSFCGRKRPEVRLGAGPHAYICDDCVSKFADIFRKEKEQGEASS